MGNARKGQSSAVCLKNLAQFRGLFVLSFSSFVACQSLCAKNRQGKNTSALIPFLPYDSSFLNSPCIFLSILFFFFFKYCLQVCVKEFGVYACVQYDDVKCTAMFLSVYLIIYSYYYYNISMRNRSYEKKYFLL